MRHQNKDRIANFTNGGEVFECVKAGFGKDMRVDDQGAVKSQKQGVAVGF